VNYDISAVTLLLGADFDKAPGFPTDVQQEK